MDAYISVKISIGTVMKNQEMLKYIPDHLKLKKCVNMQLKKLRFLIRYVPNQYKTQQMCDKAILENGGSLWSVPVSTKFNRCVIMLVIVTLMH